MLRGDTPVNRTINKVIGRLDDVENRLDALENAEDN